jgi:2,3-bisphosphoglycerate-dependent phosphoglycerate mutase
VDVRLSDQGVLEARRAGELLAESGLKPVISYTSVLTRAIQTADIALLGADRAWIPVKRSWRLNERHYGALQGKDKAQTLAEFGEEQFMTWRRSFDVPPPAPGRRRRVVAVRRRALRRRARRGLPAHLRASSS